MIADTATDNRAMRAALARAGFDPSGHFTHTFHNGDSVPAVRYISTAPYVEAPGSAEATTQ